MGYGLGLRLGTVVGSNRPIRLRLGHFAMADRIRLLLEDVHHVVSYVAF